MTRIKVMSNVTKFGSSQRDRGRLTSRGINALPLSDTIASLITAYSMERFRL